MDCETLVSQQDEKVKRKRKREGDDVVGERETKEGSTTASQVLPRRSPLEIRVYDSDHNLVRSSPATPIQFDASMSKLKGGWTPPDHPCLNRPMDPQAFFKYNQKMYESEGLDDEAVLKYKKQIYESEGLDPEVVLKYNQQIHESEGFDIFDFPGLHMRITIVPLPRIKQSPSNYEAIVNLAKLAINQYNIEHNEEYEFIDLEKVNALLVSGSIYFITFQVKNHKAAGNGNVDGDGTPLETFQARVWRGITKTDVELCRPKPIKLQN